MAAKRNNSFQAKVMKTVNGQFVLKLDEKQSITIAKKFLPPGIKKGDLLTLEFYTADQIKKRQKNLARAVLQEILGE